MREDVATVPAPPRADAAERRLLGAQRVAVTRPLPQRGPAVLRGLEAENRSRRDTERLAAGIEESHDLHLLSLPPQLGGSQRLLQHAKPLIGNGAEEEPQRAGSCA